jgi:hypothetical protein
VNILFITSIAVVAPDPTRSRTLFVDALGLPLEASPGSDYFHSERITEANTSASGRSLRRRRRASVPLSGPPDGPRPR